MIEQKTNHICASPYFKKKSDGPKAMQKKFMEQHRFTHIVQKLKAYLTLDFNSTCIETANLLWEK